MSLDQALACFLTHIGVALLRPVYAWANEQLRSASTEDADGD